MTYVEMTVDEALKLYGSNHKVLVAKQVLGENYISKFERKTYGECENIIRNSEALVRSLDDFIESIKVYSVRKDLEQNKIIEKLIHTILVE